MAKLPEPPAIPELQAIAPCLKLCTAGEILWRVYFRGGAHPTLWNAFRHWGPAGGRFDHHLGDPNGGGRLQSRGTLYAGRPIGVCLAEVFQDGRFIDRDESSPWLVAFSLRRRVQLLHLTGPWATRIGASMAIASGRRDRARRWSQALYDAYPRAGGLAYGSSMYGGDLAVALYERSLSALPTVPRLNIALDHPGLTAPLERVAERIGYAIS